MMKKFILILVTMTAAAAPQTTGGDAAGAPAKQTAGIDTSIKQVTAADTSKHTAVDTSTTPTAAIDTSKHAGIDTSRHVSTDTSAKLTAGIDTSRQISGIDTLTKPADGIDTSKQISDIDTSAKQVPAVAAADTLTQSEPGADTASEEIKTGFRLPHYAFHAVFLVASIAVIAATLCFFLTRRRRNESRRFLTTTRLSVLDKSVQRGCRYVEANYHDPALTPETVCTSLVTGKAYLDALFMNELGINVQDFIIQVRVNAIKNHIAATPSPDINDICAKCGFADRSEAERRFSSICGGVSIMDYARSNRGKI